MSAPRLLTPRQARRYLGDSDPLDFGILPIFAKGEARYDRVAIDARLDELGGISPTVERNDPEADLQAWLSARGRTA
jgi:hypothetical protein